MYSGRCSCEGAEITRIALRLQSCIWIFLCAYHAQLHDSSEQIYFFFEAVNPRPSIAEYTKMSSIILIPGKDYFYVTFKGGGKTTKSVTEQHHSTRPIFSHSLYKQLPAMLTRFIS